MDTSSVSAPLALAAGALSFVSPCVLPLVPVYLGYLSGSALTDEEQPNRWHVFSHALFFVAGFTMVFTLVFGLPATLVGGALVHFKDLVAVIGGVLVVLFGLHMLGVVNIPLLNVTRRLEIRHGAAPSFARSALFGVAFAAGWTPCIGPLLGAAMSIAVTQPSEGVIYIFIYALGLAIPFLFTALLVTRATGFLKRLNRHAHVVQKVSGGFLILVGVLLITGKFSSLNAVFIQLTPDWLTNHL